MPERDILPSINKRATSLRSNIKNQCLTNNNTLVLNKKLFKAREITSPISIKTKNNDNNASPRSKSTIRLGLCTSPVTKRDLEAVKTRQEVFKHKDSCVSGRQ